MVRTVDAVTELLLRVLSDHPDEASHEGVDLVVVAEPDHDVGELVDAVAIEVGCVPHDGRLHVVRTGATARASTPLASLDLCSGDAVVIGPAVERCPPPRTPPARTLVLDVVAGPESGRSIVLRTGATTIGRSRRADVTLADPTISRRQATVIVSAEGVVSVVAERDASNATAIDATTLAGGQRGELEQGRRLSIGGTDLVLRVVDRPEPTRPCGGAVEFHRTPYRPAVVDPIDVAEVGPIPSRPEPRRLQLIAVIAPLIAGIGMFAIVGQAQFLLFTLISPVVLIGTAIDDRRTGRRSHADAVVAFRSMLSDRRAEFGRLAEAERIARHRASPDLATLIRRARHRSVDLWARGRTAPDFLQLRVGRGEVCAGWAIELERGGDDDYRAEAIAALDAADRIDDVPITVDLAAGVVGIHGHPGLVAATAASLLVQIATLHSPDDVTVVAAVSPDRDLDWMKWLPHLRSATSPVRGDHVATDASDADALVESLLEVASFRTAGRHDAQRCWPMVVAVLDASLGADPSAVSRLLDLAPAASIAVLWLADDVAAVPRHARMVLQVEYDTGARSVGRLWSTDTDTPERRVDLEQLRADVAEHAARALAPVRDASAASRTSSIPRIAPLFDVLGGDATDAGLIAARWVRGMHDPALPFAIGLDAHGPLDLDLVADGPHTLIGGTSGAGKSELLQSMVASLAAAHSPERLNFLFVDYKGGASSQVFQRLPHTVGYVTNLSADLALRALTSLRAELNRRMALLEGRAKDLAELLERRADDAPPSLVIVVDEFATLAQEVPDFVAGIVDIAQRGRSLGIHLVLATQRPSGSVNENILANTNLRISLRMLDRAESTSILGCSDAADIPVPLRGRGLVRLGPGRLVEFQSAFAGAPSEVIAQRAAVAVARFVRPHDRPSVGASAFETGPTQLDVVLDGIVEANEGLALSSPRRPWCDVLPPVVTVDELWDDERVAAVRAEPGRHVVVGLLDAPETQQQHAAVVDLEATGGLLVVGAGGSGKTSLLRALAVAADRASRGADGHDEMHGEVATFALDGAGRGLVGLAHLPTVVGVATGDDLETVTRQLLVLGVELDRRRAVLAAAGTESLSAMRACGHEDLGRISVLIDGFDALAAQLFDVAGPLGTGGEAWADLLQRIVVDGRQVGIHTVIATSRRAAVPARLQSAIGARLVLRHADPQAYAEFGIRPDRATALDTVGRALLDGVTVQLAVVSSDPSPTGQHAAIAHQAASAAPCRRSIALRTCPLPDDLAPADLSADVAAGDAAGVATSVFGRADVDGRPATVDVEWSHIAIVGPPRSGRTTALAAVVAGLAPDERVVAVGPLASPLGRLAAVASRVDEAGFGSPEVIAATLDRVANLATVADAGQRFIIAVDDLDALDDPMLGSLWSRLVATGRVRLVAAVDTRSMTGYAADPAITELRRARRMLVLQPDDPNEFLQLTGVKLPARPGLRWRAGRGVLLVDRVPSIVQVANVSATTADVVAA